MSSESKATHVFISYSQDSPAHRETMLTLANRLRGDGIHAEIDQYHPHPPEGWPRWMEHQLAHADFILAVCTPTYRRRFEGKETPGTGKGANWEGMLATQILYDTDARNQRIVPVLWKDESEEAIPAVLRAYTYYRLPGSYESLYHRLTGQPQIVAPPVGQVRKLAPRPLRSDLGQHDDD